MRYKKKGKRIKDKTYRGYEKKYIISGEEKRNFDENMEKEKMFLCTQEHI